MGGVCHRRRLCRRGGALFAFSKGSISPETLGVGKSVDGLVMVLLGGVQTLVGPVVGAVSFTWLQDVMARSTDYWHALLGAVILILVLLFPQGIAGFFGQLWQAQRAQRGGRPVSLLHVENLGKSFGGVKAVDGIHFELKAGELLALIGPNGRASPPPSTWSTASCAPTAARSAGRHRTGGPAAAPDLAPGGGAHLPDRRHVFLAHRGRERADGPAVAGPQAVFDVDAGGTPPPQRRAGPAGQVGMAAQADRPCSVLAYGDVKRVELAVAMANNPKLLLMDEPTAGMAPKERNELMALTKAGGGARYCRAVHRAQHGRGVRLRRPHGGAGARAPDRRGRAEAIRNDPKVQEVYFGTGKTFEKRGAAQEQAA
jgi:branched-chain amino acid transport system ATP-binding protein